MCHKSVTYTADERERKKTRHVNHVWEKLKTGSLGVDVMRSIIYRLSLYSFARPAPHRLTNVRRYLRRVFMGAVPACERVHLGPSDGCCWMRGSHKKWLA